MTLEAMLRLIAGAFVTASVVLGVFVSPYFFSLYNSARRDKLAARRVSRVLRPSHP